MVRMQANTVYAYARRSAHPQVGINRVRLLAAAKLTGLNGTPLPAPRPCTPPRGLGGAGWYSVYSGLMDRRD